MNDLHNVECFTKRKLDKLVDDASFRGMLVTTVNVHDGVVSCHTFNLGVAEYLEPVFQVLRNYEREQLGEEDDLN